MLGDDPTLEPFKHMLTARTEGNPLFLEESIRALVETGTLAGERGAYRLAEPLEAIAVPATVQAILAARIDRLSPDEKRLLQAASVVSKDVPLELLRAVADLGEPDVPRVLGRLTAAEFLDEGSLFTDPEYTFKHALTQEVAYGSLLHERRRDLHARIVDAMERLHAERLSEHVERLAHHALRGEVWDKAVTYLRRAGLKAIVRSAHPEAIDNLESALTALSHLSGDRESLVLGVDLRLDLVLALAQSARYADILQRMTEAAPLAESLGDRARLGQVVQRMAQALRLTGDYATALGVGQRAVAVADELGDALLRSGTRHRLGQIYFTVGDYPRAAQLLRESVALLGERMGMADELGYVLGVGPLAWLGEVLASLGEFTEALALGRQALRLADREAIPILERGLALCRTWSILDWSPTMTSALATAVAREGQVDEAIVLHQRAEEEEARQMQGTPGGRILRFGETYLLAQRIDDARACAERALGLSRTAGEDGAETRALRLLAEIEVAGPLSDSGRSERHLTEALDRSEAHGARPDAARCQLALGLLHARMGRRQQAEERLQIALAMFRRMDMPYWADQTAGALRELPDTR